MITTAYLVDKGLSGQAKYNLTNVPDNYFGGAYKENPTSFTYRLEGNQWIDVYPYPNSDLARADFEPGAILHSPWGKRFGGTELSVVMPHPSLNDYVNSIFARLDSLIELDFYEHRDWADGRTGLFRAGNYEQNYLGQKDLQMTDLSIAQLPSLPDSILGISLANDGYSHDWKQRLTEYDEITNFWTTTGNSIFDAYVILHELGHALGLEHPHDKGLDQNDGSLSQNGIDASSWRDTIMSYNVDASIINEWDLFFRPLDVEALIEIWGPETGEASIGANPGHEGYLSRLNPNAGEFEIMEDFFHGHDHTHV